MSNDKKKDSLSKPMSISINKAGSLKIKDV
jgi:hypothetical protein